MIQVNTCITLLLATQLYLGRCLDLQANPPAPDWAPVTNLEFFNQPRTVI